MTPSQEEYKADMLKIWAWLRAKFLLVTAAIWDWQIAHPVLSKCAACLMIGLILGLIAGCASFDHVYWCLQSSPGNGGPFCP